MVSGEKEACWPGREETKQKTKLNKVYVKMPEGSLVLCVLNDSESNKQSLSSWSVIPVVHPLSVFVSPNIVPLVMWKPSCLEEKFTKCIYKFRGHDIDQNGGNKR